MTDAARPPVATVVEEELQFSLDELSRSCDCSTQWLIELVLEGVLEPQGDVPQQWRFSGVALRRARTAWHLARDLELNAPGVALALDLIEEVHSLRLQLKFGTGDHR
jgi:chaperone modulatory protein CbpM